MNCQGIGFTVKQTMCNAIATEHGRCGLSCMQKLWGAQAVLSLYGMLECKLCCEIVLLLNVADVLYAGRLVSEQW